MKAEPTTSVSETALANEVYRRLSETGGISAKQEVPLLGRTVDLVFEEDHAIFSVEFKIKDWRRALLQARDHRLGADFAYVCMPRRALTDAMIREFRAAGVGLFFFNCEGTWPFTIVLEAPESSDTWIVARSYLCEFLVEEKGAEL